MKRPVVLKPTNVSVFLYHWLNQCSLTGDALVPNLIRMVFGHSVDNGGASIFLSQARISSPRAS